MPTEDDAKVFGEEDDGTGVMTLKKTAYEGRAWECMVTDEDRKTGVGG